MTTGTKWMDRIAPFFVHSHYVKHLCNIVTFVLTILLHTFICSVVRQSCCHFPFWGKHSMFFVMLEKWPTAISSKFSRLRKWERSINRKDPLGITQIKQEKHCRKKSFYLHNDSVQFVWMFAKGIKRRRFSIEFDIWDVSVSAWVKNENCFRYIVWETMKYNDIVWEKRFIFSYEAISDDW